MGIILIKEKGTRSTWMLEEDKGDRPLTVYLTKERVKLLGGLQTIKVTAV